MDHASGPFVTEALRHLDALYTLARWLVRDPDAAEDLVQETYRRALRAAHQFQPGPHLRVWLYQILRNTCYTRYRRTQEEPNTVDPEALGRAAQARGASRRGAGLAGSVDGAAGLDVTAALQRLPEAYRSVVLLADLEDFTLGEIAAIMDCPVGTVQSRLFRARRVLRDLLPDSDR
jgi:RNA polymerase sigma-70 factor (ECF subfamily)